MFRPRCLYGSTPSRGDSVAIISLALIIFAGYLATIAPDIQWLDSSELQTIAIVLGNGHPPGEPLHSVICHVMRFVPIGSLAFRMTLMSAITGVMASIIVYVILIQIAGLFKQHIRLYDRLVAFGVILYLAFSPALWIQATRCEVYSLNFLLTAIIVYAVINALLTAQDAADHNTRESICRHPYLKTICLMSFILGLACGNHPLLIALTGPPILVFIILPHLPLLRFKGILTCALFFIFGLSVYLYLPLRAVTLPPVNWGNPNSLERLIWMISGNMFQKSFILTTGKLLLNIQEAAFILMHHVSIILFFLGILGLWLSIRRQFLLGGFLISALLCNMISVVTQQVFIGTNPDLYGYLLFSVLILMMGAYGVFTQCLGFVESRLNPNMAGIAAVLILTLLTVIAAVGLPGTLKATDKHDLYSANIFGKAVLNTAEPGSYIVTSNIETLFVTWYLQHVEHYRQDITVIHNPFMSFEWYRESLPDQIPDLESMAVQEIKSIEDLLPYLENSPLYFELGIGINDDLMPHLSPNGLIFAYRRQKMALDPKMLALQRLRMKAIDAVMTGDKNDVEALKSIYWQHYCHGIFYAKRKLYSQARWAFEKCLSITPGSKDLRSLIQQLEAERNTGRPGQWTFNSQRKSP